MRGSRWVISCALLWSGCWGGVSQPELRRPLETLPDGACLILVASDLGNTWERAEAHNAVDIVRRIIPHTILARPGINDLGTRLDTFEQRTGTRVRDDILLNALGGRVAMGAYPRTRTGSVELLFVAELENAESFARALDALRAEEDTGVQFEDTKLDDRDAIRMSDDRGLDLLLIQHESLLVVTSDGDLARGALDIHTGTADNSALRDPTFVDAVDELGLHNVVVVEPDGGENKRWRAQGFSWDETGVHFKRVVRVTADAAPTPPLQESVHRDAILHSIPTGMTLAYYARPTDIGLVRELFLGGEDCFDLRGPSEPGTRFGAHTDGFEVRPAGWGAPARIVPAAPPLGMDQLPFGMAAELLPWVGDEMAFVLGDLVETPIAQVPSAALIVEVADPELAERTLASFDDVVLKFGPVDFRGFEEARYGGKTYKTLAQPLLDAVSLSYLVDGELCVITTTRELMQLIIDTRRVGNRHLLRDSSFQPFQEFVPEAASAVLYADQRRLQRSLQQLSNLAWLGGDVVAQALEVLDGLSVLFDHFPAGAVYLESAGQTVTMNGWMLEDE